MLKLPQITSLITNQNEHLKKNYRPAGILFEE